MNTLSTAPSLANCALPTQPVSAIARRRSPWRWCFLGFGVLAVLATFAFVALLLSFRMGGEARSVRKAVFAAAPGVWERKFELGVGRFPAFLARAGFRVADGPLDLPPEAAAGIAAFRSADVGIYHRRRSAADPGSARTAFGRVDEAMRERDWDPIVSVQEGGRCVRVFVPNTLADTRDARACVVVQERDQLIIVSARLDLEPLLDIVQRKFSEQGFLHALR